MIQGVHSAGHCAKHFECIISVNSQDNKHSYWFKLFSFSFDVMYCFVCRWAGIADGQGLCVHLQRRRNKHKSFGRWFFFLTKQSIKNCLLDNLPCLSGSTCHVCLGEPQKNHNGHKTSESCTPMWVDSTWPSELVNPSPHTVHEPRRQEVICFMAEKKNRSGFAFHL